MKIPHDRSFAREYEAARGINVVNEEPVEGAPEPMDTVNHPAHYGGGDDPYETIKVIEAWDLGFHLGNAVKYISRAGKKSRNALEDLEKARWYLNREIDRLTGGADGNTVEPRS